MLGQFSTLSVSAFVFTVLTMIMCILLVQNNTNVNNLNKYKGLVQAVLVISVIMVTLVVIISAFGIYSGTQMKEAPTVLSSLRQAATIGGSQTSRGLSAAGRGLSAARSRAGSLYNRIRG
jgi:CDP-diglyceride synthetase